MPATSPDIIVHRLIDAIHQSGGVAAYVSESVQTQPRKFIISHLEHTYSLWVYIWTLTHGGREALPDEFRIQMTSVPSPLHMNPDGFTVLMGYHPDSGVFAGFDLGKHGIFKAGSPSVQINITALHDAVQNGLSFTTKSNDEIGIGIRADQFLNYCFNASPLHLYGSESELTTMLSKAVQLQEIPKEDVAALTKDRKQIVESVSRYSRDASFRKSVMSAYDNRCAVTRSQLRLVDAAHILPVPSDYSSDHVTNGLALSPTFHRAYDNCLIYLDENFLMKLNEEKAEELKVENLDNGLDDFCSFLDKKIHLPTDKNQRPKIEYIIRANKYRRIPGYI